MQARQVGHHPEGARQAVFRLTELSRAVIHHDLGHPSPQLAGNGRQIAVHAGPQEQRLDDRRAEYLQRAAVVVQLDAGDDGDEQVGSHRRQVAREDVVLTVPAPTADDVVGLRQRHQGREIRGIVLPVTVHGGNERGARLGKAGRERGALPEVAREAHGHHARGVGGVQAPQVIPRAVGAAVVDEDQFVVQAVGCEDSRDLFDQRHDIVGFVAQRHDEGQGPRLRHATSVSARGTRQRPP